MKDYVNMAPKNKKADTKTKAWEIIALVGVSAFFWFVALLWVGF